MKQSHNFSDRGYLITLEGIDGSGKTTLARSLYEQLMRDAIPALLTKEPGATSFGKEIRAMVQNPQTPRPSLAEFFLFAADRVAHIDQVVKPALAAKNVVICDRMADSSVAYQGFGRGISIDAIEIVNKIAMLGIEPDITFYLDIDYQTAHARIMQRNEALSQFDQEKEEFFRRVARGYEYVYHNRTDVLHGKAVEKLLEQIAHGEAPRYHGEKVFYLDAKKSPEQLRDYLLQIIAWTQKDKHAA